MLYDPRWDRDPRPHRFFLLVACVAATLLAVTIILRSNQPDELSVACTGAAATCLKAPAETPVASPVGLIFTYR